MVICKFSTSQLFVITTRQAMKFKDILLSESCGYSSRFVSNKKYTENHSQFATNFLQGRFIHAPNFILHQSNDNTV